GGRDRAQLIEQLVVCCRRAVGCIARSRGSVRIPSVLSRVGVHCDHDLHQVTSCLGSFCLILDALEDGKGQPHEGGDENDDNEKFDQGKRCHARKFEIRISKSETTSNERNDRNETLATPGCLKHFSSKIW